jgi:hypothetical protein
MTLLQITTSAPLDSALVVPNGEVITLFSLLLKGGYMMIPIFCFPSLRYMFSWNES